MIGRFLTVAAALALAAVLGVSDAPNASSALIAAGEGSYRRVAAWSAAWHLAGGLLAGSAVATTLVSLVRVSPALLAPTLVAGCAATILFTTVTTRRGLPTSASVGLVGGLAGAGLVAGGWKAVEWGGLHGFRLVGVVGVLLGILLAPLIGGLAAAGVNRPARRASRRLSRHALRPVRGGIWVTSAAVALADGSNDGQKAMGILAAALAGTGVLAAGHPIPLWQRAACAAVLAVATGVAGHLVVAKVAKGLARANPVDGLSAQTASAAVILLAAASGLPLSTSTVVASSMVGAGAARRHRHVRWHGVAGILGAWALTVPACALLGAALLGGWRVAAG
ncbi:MAG TPA: inorganic phosphate transporter [Actinomycetota bacterium]|nr:inorganic phosphate transporter [Actinomycetota bacterium]